MPTAADRLASLPAPIAPLAQAVIDAADDKALAKLMAAVKLSPRKDGVLERPIALARTLKPDQRAVAELLAELPEVSLEDWPLYAAPWLRRRSLGLEPGGALFAEIVLQLDDAKVRWPLIHGVRHLVNVGDEERAVALLAALPLAERLEVMVGLAAAERDVDMSCFGELIEQTAAALRDNAELGELPSTLAEWAKGVCAGELPSAAATLLLAAGAKVEPPKQASAESSGKKSAKKKAAKKKAAKKKSG